ncbi:MAG: aminotransferase class I/II-fold pyridoxal phosphate-dependent enzyme [Paracoccaceae bacterium]
MAYPERLSALPPYAWPRLRALLDGIVPSACLGGAPVDMTIGEPRHPFPDLVGRVLVENLESFGRYPPNEGSPELLDAIRGYLGRRYGVDPAREGLMVLNGTREGLFDAGLALAVEGSAVAMPNPFYQPYMASALAAGTRAVSMPATEATGHLPDPDALDAATLDALSLVYLCSPANPQGTVMGRDMLARWLALAEKHDFRILSDECYAEIYRHGPPPGILEVAAQTGADMDRVLCVHSLSKRSNLPGLRSGFAAGGAEPIRRLRQIRAYGGAPVPGPIQAVSAALWADDDHVAENRALYAAKYEAAEDILGGMPGYATPEAGFFLWLSVEDGEAAAVKLWREAGVRTLPGAYLSAPEPDGTSPGDTHLRVAMCAPYDDTVRGLRALRACLHP